SSGTGTSTTAGSGNLIRGQSGFAGGIVSTANPLLGPLQYNGGPTQTLALSTGSPAINAGAAAGAPGLDQRGYSRSGTVDIGAFEFGGVATIQAQTITFGPLVGMTYGDADFALSATATSSLPVSFTATGNARVYQDQTGAWYVHILGAGSATIT